MRRFVQFLRSTIIGGVFVLAPLVVLAIIVVQTVELVHSFLKPVVALLPFQTVGGVSIAALAAVLLLIFVCFMAGLVAELSLTKRLLRTIESLILARIPGYSLMKSVGENLAGVQSSDGRKTVLVHFADSAQIGFLMSTLPDGRLLVFVPDVPSALTGRVHVIGAEQVEILPLTVTAALDSLGRLGIGLEKSWPART